MAELHILAEATVRDIPAMLRRSADAIEAGAEVKSAVLITVDPAGEVETYGWGDTHAVDTLAVLQLATFKLARSMVDGPL